VGGTVVAGGGTVVAVTLGAVASWGRLAQATHRHIPTIHIPRRDRFMKNSVGRMIIAIIPCWLPRIRLFILDISKNQTTIINRWISTMISCLRRFQPPAIGCRMNSNISLLTAMLRCEMTEQAYVRFYGRQHFQSIGWLCQRSSRSGVSRGFCVLLLISSPHHT